MRVYSDISPHSKQFSCKLQIGALQLGFVCSKSIDMDLERSRKKSFFPSFTDWIAWFLYFVGSSFSGVPESFVLDSIEPIQSFVASFFCAPVKPFVKLLNYVVCVLYTKDEPFCHGKNISQWSKTWKSIVSSSDLQSFSIVLDLIHFDRFRSYENQAYWVKLKRNNTLNI